MRGHQRTATSLTQTVEVATAVNTTNIVNSLANGSGNAASVGVNVTIALTNASDNVLLTGFVDFTSINGAANNNNMITVTVRRGSTVSGTAQAVVHCGSNSTSNATTYNDSGVCSWSVVDTAPGGPGSITYSVWYYGNSAFGTI